MNPEFQARVVLDGTANYVPGQRAYLRFKLDKKPLAWQWYRKFSQLIQSKSGTSKWL